MPAATSPSRQKNGLDDFDLDEFGDLFGSPTPPPESGEATSKKRKDAHDDLGLEGEAVVAKRARVPRIKLDEERLLSDQGIPKLRSRAKNLRFKGKGHEFSDAARLLSFYQLWLDDLFPKAKFLDALAMVEKAGHKTTMLSQRKEWMAEARRQKSAADDGDSDAELGGSPIHERRGEQRPSSHSRGDGRTGDKTPTRNGADGVPEDGEDGRLDMTAPQKQPSPPASGEKTAAKTISSTLIDDEEEFESLLKEMEEDGAMSLTNVAKNTATGIPRSNADAMPDGFEDDEAALAEMGLW